MHLMVRGVIYMVLALNCYCSMICGCLGMDWIVPGKYVVVGCSKYLRCCYGSIGSCASRNYFLRSWIGGASWHPIIRVDMGFWPCWDELSYRKFCNRLLRWYDQIFFCWHLLWMIRIFLFLSDVRDLYMQCRILSCGGVGHFIECLWFPVLCMGGLINPGVLRWCVEFFRWFNLLLVRFFGLWALHGNSHMLRLLRKRSMEWILS